MPFDGTNVSEVQLTLIAARELIRKGWCKGRLEKNLKAGPAYCVIGAIQHVIYTGQIDCSKVQHLDFEREVRKAFVAGAGLPADLGLNLSRWNDTKGRKKEEILEAFDRAIAAVE